MLAAGLSRRMGDFKPPLIDARMIPAILAFHGEGGLRELWKRFEKEIRTVPVDDAGVWTDIDTPDDYRKCREQYEAYNRLNGIQGGASVR